MAGGHYVRDQGRHPVPGLDRVVYDTSLISRMTSWSRSPIRRVSPRQAGRDRSRLAGWPAPAENPAVSAAYHDRPMEPRTLSFLALCLLLATAAPAHDRNPAFSPDGQRLLFESDRTGDWEIWVRELDGGGERRLTRHPGDDRGPAWFPDGGRIVFRSDRGGRPDLWVLALEEGAEPVRLTDDAAAEAFPHVSPDGSRVAYTVLGDAPAALYLVDADAGEPRQLLSGEHRHVWPRWSPDGERVALFSRRDTAGEDDEVYLLDVESGELTRVTERPGHDFCPAWGSDGRSLVVVSLLADGGRELRRIDLEGRTLAVHGRGAERATEPSVSPDGKWLAYTALAADGEGFEIRLEPLSE